MKPGPSIAGLNLRKLVQPVWGHETGAFRPVRGTYEHRRGPDHNGRLRGRIMGMCCTSTADNIDTAIMPVKGKAWFRIARSGRKLTGRYGYDDSNDDGGVWTADKSNYN